MEANITGESSERVGMNVTDNNCVEHLIEMEFDGEIKYHTNDIYPDHPSDRTLVENEHFNHAWRYAKWHVYRERGYDTLTPYENPDRIIAAMMVLSEMSSSRVESEFEPLLTQLQSHFDESEVSLPFEDAEPEDNILYRTDIFVQPDPTECEPPLLDQFCEVTDSLPTSRTELLETLGDINPLTTDLDDIQSDLFGGDIEVSGDLPEFELEGVSELHYEYSADGETHFEWGDSPVDREPDARIELVPLDPSVFLSFDSFLVSHLGNQIRDCFLLMGCEPPDLFKQQGLGRHDASITQNLVDLYDEYYKPSAEIDSWQPGAE